MIYGYSLSANEIIWLCKQQDRNVNNTRDIRRFESQINLALNEWSARYTVSKHILNIIVHKHNIQIESNDEIVGHLLLRTIIRPARGLNKHIRNKPLPQYFEKLISDYSKTVNMNPTLTNNWLSNLTIFISHASEDKIDFVRPLAEQMRKMGFTVWYDEFSLNVGDSLRQSIDSGLSMCDFGIVVLSYSFFSKNWPQWELDGLVAKEIFNNKKVILPIWHNIEFKDIIEFSPPLANRLAVSSSLGVEEVVNRITRSIIAQQNVTTYATETILPDNAQISKYRDGFWDMNVTDCSYFNEKGWETFSIRGEIEFFKNGRKEMTPYEKREIGDMILDLNPPHNIKIRYPYSEGDDYVDYISYNQIGQIELSGSSFRLLSFRNFDRNDTRILLSFESSLEEEIIYEILKIVKLKPHINFIDMRL